MHWTLDIGHWTFESPYAVNQQICVLECPLLRSRHRGNDVAPIRSRHRGNDVAPIRSRHLTLFVRCYKIVAHLEVF